MDTNSRLSIENTYDIESSLGELASMRAELSPLPRNARLKFHRLLTRMEWITRLPPPQSGQANLKSILIDLLADRFGDQSSNSNKYKIRGRLRHQSNVHPLEVARLFSNCLDHIFLECGGRPNKLELCLEEVNNIAQVTFLYSRKDAFLEPKSFAFALASRKAIRLGAWLSQKNIQNKAQMTVSFPRTPNVSRCGLSKKRPAEKFNFRLTAP